MISTAARHHDGVTTMLKHTTASVFLFAATPEHGWRLGLVQHPRLCRWMLPGGHVEPHENPAEAALREVQEETGLAAGLVRLPSLGDPGDAADIAAAAPAWLVEQRV